VYVDDDEQDEEPGSELYLGRIVLYKGVKPPNRYMMDCYCFDAAGGRYHTSKSRSRKVRAPSFRKSQMP
jgi:hypothetical protein